MTFAPVGSFAQTQTASLSLDPATVGDIILCAVFADSAEVSATGITGGNCSWVQISGYVGLTNPVGVFVFAGTVTATGSATATIVFNGTTPALSAVAQEFSVSAGWSADVQGFKDVATGTSACPSLTPAGTGELYFSYLGSASELTSTAGSTSGFTYHVDSYGFGLCFDASCGTGAQAPTWGSNFPFGIAVLLKPSPPAGGQSWVTGAYLDQGNMGVSSISAAISQFAGFTGISVPVVRYYLAESDWTYYADMAWCAANGVKMVITLRPAYNPVSATDLSNMAGLLSTMKTAGLVADIALWHEPYYEGLTSAQFIAMFQYYGPTVREYYPVVFCTAASSVQNPGENENSYYPGNGYVDKIATDLYCYSWIPADGGSTLDDAAAIANQASPPMPFGLYELNTSTDPTNGQTQAQADAFFAYIQAYFTGRHQAGLPNSDILIFNQGEIPDNETLVLTSSSDYRIALFQDIYTAGLAGATGGVLADSAAAADTLTVRGAGGLVQSCSATAAGVTSCAATFTTQNVTAGNKYIVAVACNTATVTSVKNGAGTSLTQLATEANSSSGVYEYLFAMDIPSGDGGTKPVITVTFPSSAYGAVVVEEVAGLLAGNTSAMLDGTAGGSEGTASTTASPSYSSAVAGEYLVGLFGTSSNVLPAAPSGYTADPGNADGEGACCIYRKNSTGAAESCAITVGSSVPYAELLVAFKLAIPVISYADDAAAADQITTQVTGIPHVLITAPPPAGPPPPPIRAQILTVPQGNAAPADVAGAAEAMTVGHGHRPPHRRCRCGRHDQRRHLPRRHRRRPPTRWPSPPIPASSATSPPRSADHADRRRPALHLRQRRQHRPRQTTGLTQSDAAAAADKLTATVTVALADRAGAADAIGTEPAIGASGGATYPARQPRHVPGRRRRARQFYLVLPGFGMDR